MSFTQLFPTDVQFEIANPEDFSAVLPVQEQALIERAVEKRRREFTAGRVCARRALQKLGQPVDYLLIGEQRQPQWPSGVVGSISHCPGFCAAAVAESHRVMSIGFDAEQRAGLGEELHRIILRPEEMHALAQLPATLPWDRMTFSAKECIHKVYFPLNSYTLDFVDARVRFNPDDQSFVAEIVNPAPNERVPLRTLHGQFCFTHSHIFTAITVFAK
ncbi:MAG TPA: 4'-phosphopantetheinyl transferase superfamily protein [Pseudomonadales bacterium]|nr:4'-phosphopantetheinyl transferase superfamily protein [Pseudomonadales bacterium]